MTNEQVILWAPAFVLVAARVGGMAMAAPVFGSALILFRVRILIALVLALGLFPAVAKPVPLPATAGQAVALIGGELAFGVAIGFAMRLVFVAVQWAGEMIGQQMGLDLGGVYDPNFGEGGSTTGGIYALLALVIFLIAGGHRAMLSGVRTTFEAVPLMTAGLDRPVFDMMLAVLSGSMSLVIRLAAPMLVTMLIVDLAIGFVGRTVPQLATFGTGVSIRPIVGMAVLAIGVALSADVIAVAIKQSMWIAEHSWARLAGP